MITSRSSAGQGVCAAGAATPAADVARRRKAVVIGAGFAGISSARTLLEQGRDWDVVVLEIGQHGAAVELGATWIHGIEGNPLYAHAVELGLLEPQRLSGFQWPRPRLLPEHSPKQLDGPLLAVAMTAVDAFAAALEEAKEAGEGTAGVVLRRAWDALLAAQLAWGAQEVATAAAAWRWRELLQRAIDGCHDTRDMACASLVHYSDLPGPHVTIPRGFQSLAEALAEGLDIRFRTEVVRIEYGPSGCTLRCADGRVFEADAAIVTVSVGVLKARHAELFAPPLPADKAAAITAIGMGVVNKVVVELDLDAQPTHAPQHSATPALPAAQAGTSAPPAAAAAAAGPGATASSAAASSSAAAGGSGSPRASDSSTNTERWGFTLLPRVEPALGAPFERPSPASARAARAPALPADVSGGCGDTYPVGPSGEPLAGGIDWLDGVYALHWGGHGFLQYRRPGADACTRDASATGAGEVAPAAAAALPCAQDSAAGTGGGCGCGRGEGRNSGGVAGVGSSSEGAGAGAAGPFRPPPPGPPVPPAAARAVAMLWVSGAHALALERVDGSRLAADVQALLDRFPGVQPPPPLGEGAGEDSGCGTSGGDGAGDDGSGGRAGSGESGGGESGGGPGGRLRVARAYRSSWGTDPAFRGSYSYISARSTPQHILSLASPVEFANRPVLLFAGEATHSKHFGTATGAYLTGQREAERLLRAWGGGCGDADGAAANDTHAAAQAV